MTRGGGGGGGKEEAVGKVMGPLFPRLHVSDAGRGGGPRAPPRNKMALYEQFTVPSSRFSSPAPTRAAGATLVPSTSASQVYGYDRPLFQPFNVPSNEPAHSSKRINNSNSTRKESGRLSSQTNNNTVYAGGSTAECTSQHRVDNIAKNSSGKKLANDDEFMVPSICSPLFPPHSTQEHARVQEKLNTHCATGAHKNPPATSKSSAKCYNPVNEHLDRINVSDMRSRTSPKSKEKEPAQGMNRLEAKEKGSSIQGSKDRFRNEVAEICSKKDKTSPINGLGKLQHGTSVRQAASTNGSSMKIQNPTTTKDMVSCNPRTKLDKTNRKSYLLEETSREAGAKRKRSPGQHDVEQNDDSSDSVECIPGWEISPDEIAAAIGSKHFWKARKAIQNQQRVFAVQVFELHKLINVQKLISASPHLLIEGAPCLGNVLVGKKDKLPKGNLNVHTVPVANKDGIQPTLEQTDLSKENIEGNPQSPSRYDGLHGNHQDHAAANGEVPGNHQSMPSAPDNKNNNWCMNPPQNQWLVPVMSPSEGLVYKPFAGPCPPAGSLFAPFYANCTPLRPPSTAYGVPMPHQPYHMAPPGAPAVPMNYFPPFSLPVTNPVAATSAVEQGSHGSQSLQNGHVEQQSRISCNISHLSRIWRFHASRDSEPQASSASSPFNRFQGDGSAPVSFFPDASVQNAQPLPSSVSREKHNHVIRVPHNAQTASESAARIFRSIQMERQQNDL
ncbi:hypothetical protein ACP4OV_011596 [Aristida adscensionis]